MSGPVRCTWAVRVKRFADAWWADVKTVRPHNHAHWPALRVGLCVTLPLALTAALGHVDWAPYAIFGSINSVYGKQSTYPARLRAQTGTGLALTAAVFTGTAVGTIAPGSWQAVIAMALFSLIGYLLTHANGWLPVPSLFLVFAVGTMSSYPHEVADLALAIVLPLAAAAFSVALGQIGRWLPTSTRPRTPDPESTPVRQVVQTASARLDMLAYVLGPLLAGLGATFAGVGHPYWAAVTATVPLVGATFAAKAARATLRILGTLAGVALSYALIAGHTTTWTLILAIAILQILTELFVARNYGIAVIAITPMALIMTYLGSPQPVEILVTDRIIETVIGAAVTLTLLMATQLTQRPTR